SGHESRPENEEADQDTPEAEENQVGVEGVTVQSDKHVCQRLQLFSRKCAQGIAGIQNEHRSEVQDTCKSMNRTAHEYHNGCEEGDAHAHRLEQIIKQKRPSDMEYHPNDRGSKSQPNNRSWARMLPAVAAALRKTTRLPRTVTWPNVAVVPSSN